MKTAKNILTDLKIVWNGMPCYDPKSDHKRHSHKDSELVGHLGKTGCTKPLQENLHNYDSVDNLTLDKFLRSNNLGRYVDNIPKLELEHFYPELLHLVSRYSITINHENEKCVNMEQHIFDSFKYSLDIYIKLNGILVAMKVFFVGIMLFFVIGSTWRKVFYMSFIFLFLNLVYLCFELGIFPFLKNTSRIVRDIIFVNGLDDIENSCLGPTHWAKIFEQYFPHISMYFEEEDLYLKIQCGVLLFITFVGFVMMKLSNENQRKDIIRQPDSSKKEKTE